MDKNKKKVAGKAVTKKKNSGVKGKAKSSNIKVKKKSKSSKLKNSITTERILLTVFILLLIIVAVLTFFVIKKKKENDNKLAANLVIPVIEKGTEENFSLNVNSFGDEDEYILKLTNYRGKKINEKEISYAVTVENNSASEIEVTKDDSADNLMIDQESIIIEDQKLKGKVKQDVFYHIKVTKKNDVKDDDRIYVKVSS